MIDTINLYQKGAYSNDVLRNLIQKADQVKTDKSAKGYVKMKYRGMHIVATNDYISISGSIPECIHGCNSYRLYYGDLRKWADDISHYLDLDIRDFSIGRIDLNFDIPVVYPPAIYHDNFVSMSHVGSFGSIKNTLYVKTDSYTVRIYDKKKKAKRYSDYLGEVLRIEFSVMKRLGSILKSGEKVYLKDILTKDGYSSLYFLSIMFFKRIKLENNDKTIRYKDAANFKEVRELIVKEWAIEKGGHVGVTKWIEKLKSYGSFKNSKGYVRLAHSLSHGLKQDTEVDLVKEIESKFYGLVRYHL